ncbi:hypothetical protein F5Y08DRAFT_354939 [Xylaria arbuscula]|nr:hypothetical protein F5Y08DRAFT_354939 [Xylaria arbuscula]
MRASATAILSFAAIAAANPTYGPPDQDVSVTVAPGSSIEGNSLVALAGESGSFPAFVPAAETADSPSVFNQFYTNYGHFGWYSLNIDIDGATYGLDIEAAENEFEGPMKFIPSSQYGTNIWGPENEGMVLKWTGSSLDSICACTRDDGHIQLAIYEKKTKPKNCEVVELTWKSAA